MKLDNIQKPLTENLTILDSKDTVQAAIINLSLALNALTKELNAELGAIAHGIDTLKRRVP